VLSLRLGEGDAVTAEGTATTGTAIVTIRPERIAIRESADGGAECHARGVVRESLYAGPTSRFVVELDGGGELMVVRQNADTGFEDAESLRGRSVVLVWARRHTRVIAINEGGDG
jgi:putative spermidine/putrescine transport system ATP-binding protein